MWRKIHVLNRFKPPPSTITLKDDYDEYSQSPTTTTELLAKTFAAISSDAQHTPTFLAYKRNAEQNLMEINSNSDADCNTNITITKIHNRLPKFIRNTSPRPDNISSTFIKHLSDQMKSTLLAIYSKIWLFGPQSLSYRFSSPTKINTKHFRTGQLRAYMRSI